MSVFGFILVRIFLHLDWIRSDTEYLVRMQENTDRNNSEYRHFLRSDTFPHFANYENFIFDEHLEFV